MTFLYKNRLESISSAAASSELHLLVIGEGNVDTDKISSFLGITAIQSIIFSCLTELSLHKIVTLDRKHNLPRAGKSVCGVVHGRAKVASG